MHHHKPKSYSQALSQGVAKRPTGVLTVPLLRSKMDKSFLSQFALRRKVNRDSKLSGRVGFALTISRAFDDLFRIDRLRAADPTLCQVRKAKVDGPARMRRKALRQSASEVHKDLAAQNVSMPYKAILQRLKSRIQRKTFDLMEKSIFTEKVKTGSTTVKPPPVIIETPPITSLEIHSWKPLRPASANSLSDEEYDRYIEVAQARQLLGLPIFGVVIN